MIKTILWDVDGTLLNFHESERTAIRKCFELFHLGACSDEMLLMYSAINAEHWRRLEAGQITREQVLIGRFQTFFTHEDMQVETDTIHAFNTEYQQQLGETVCYNDGCPDILNALRGRVHQYAVTNGTGAAQRKKLAKSGIGALLDGVFISEEVGFDKPMPEYFDYVLSHIEPCERNEILVVGDSLTSDIRGANRSGLLSCWYNPRSVRNKAGEHVDYEIRDLKEVEGLLSAAH